MAPNRALCFATLCFIFFTIQSSSMPVYPKPISDLKELIVKGLGFQPEDGEISGFDVRDALVGRSVLYEFEVEFNNKVLPVKLVDAVNQWEHVDLPMFRVEDSSKDNGLVEKKDLEKGLPVLAPFQLAGPMELWIQDAKDMRLSLPNDVDAGVLKKVILADGAVVTVKGARSVSLRHPIEFQLPLNQTRNDFASGLLSLADCFRHASRTQGAPLLSLRIVGPTSLASPSSPSPSPDNRLKLKRLAPGLMELSSPSKTKAIEATSAIDLQGEASPLLTPNQLTTLWPLTSIDGSNSNLLGFEKLISSMLGANASKEGSFKLLKVDVSSQTFMKISFAVEKKLKEKNESNWAGIPAWRTKPEVVRTNYEVLAKVDGNKIVPERVMQVDPVVIEDTVAQNVLLGNISMSRTPIYHPPSAYLTL